MDGSQPPAAAMVAGVRSNKPRSLRGEENVHRLIAAQRLVFGLRLCCTFVCSSFESNTSTDSLGRAGEGEDATYCYVCTKKRTLDGSFLLRNNSKTAQAKLTRLLQYSPPPSPSELPEVGAYWETAAEKLNMPCT